ncbi:MAG: acyclic terpene utilization AtuA family protein [Hyphomicrobiaceae bacterium]
MIRIGSGAGFSSDRLQPAVDLARDGNLHWLVFETIGERTLAFGHRDRQLDPRKGYNPHLAMRMRHTLAYCRANGTRILTNMGVANVSQAAQVVLAEARALGLYGLTVATVEGDEVTDRLNSDTPLLDAGGRHISDIGHEMVCANAYLGIDAICPAVKTGADVIVTGRVGDPSLFLAPLCAQFDWSNDDWDMLGKGTLVGHLMECGMQVSGGYFADPGVKEVANLADCGFPIAEVADTGEATITKLASAGGSVTARTVKEQLLYEVHDPAKYLTPDVTADFSSVVISEIGPDRVRVAQATGHTRPDQLKVTVGFDGGFLGEAGVSYAGPNASARARLARDILIEILDRVPGAKGSYRIDLIGLNALHATALNRQAESEDVRVRVAMRALDRDIVAMMLWEVEALLCCGPAGGGGFRGHITPSVVTHSALIDRDAVHPQVEVFTA